MGLPAAGVSVTPAETRYGRATEPPEAATTHQKPVFREGPKINMGHNITQEPPGGSYPGCCSLKSNLLYDLRAVLAGVAVLSLAPSNAWPAGSPRRARVQENPALSAIGCKLLETLSVYTAAVSVAWYHGAEVYHLASRIRAVSDAPGTPATRVTT